MFNWLKKLLKLDPEPEKVLCFKTHLLYDFGYFQGFKPYTPNVDFLKVYSPQFLYRYRNLLEKDSSYKQIIPYVILKHENKYFTYERSCEGGEARLYSKKSLGIGGHINSYDSSYEEGILREVLEELYFDAIITSKKTIGYINDDKNLVGLVHFGIVHVWELENIVNLSLRDTALKNGMWKTKEELVKDQLEFEPWSQIVIEQYP